MKPVDAGIIRTYRLYPVIVQHYTVQPALAQKVLALALREQVQSRDVFDLKLLMDAGGADRPLPATADAKLTATIDNALAVDYDAYSGQVLAYLEPEYQDHYGNKQAWSEILLHIPSLHPLRRHTRAAETHPHPNGYDLPPPYAT